MGVLDKLFGGSTNKSSSTTLVGSQTGQDTTATKTGTTTGSTKKGATTATTGSTVAKGDQTTRNLDNATIQILQDLVAQIAGRDPSGSGGLAQAPIDFATALGERAGGTQGFVDAEVAPIIAEAERKGRIGITQETTALGNAAGSSLNSIVADVGARREGDLATSLAGLESQLKLSGRQLESADLSSAFQAILGASGGALGAEQSQAAQVTELVKALSGAVSTTSGKTSTAQTGRAETQETTNTVQTITELLQEILGKEQAAATEQRGKATQGGSFDVGSLISDIITSKE